MAWEGVCKLTAAHVATVVERCAASPGDFHRIICGINLGRGTYPDGCFIPPGSFTQEQAWKCPADLIVYRSRARPNNNGKGWYRCHGQQQGENCYTLPVVGPFKTAREAIEAPVVVMAGKAPVKRFEVES